MVAGQGSYEILCAGLDCLRILVSESLLAALYLSDSGYLQMVAEVFANIFESSERQAAHLSDPHQLARRRAGQILTHLISRYTFGAYVTDSLPPAVVYTLRDCIDGNHEPDISATALTELGEAMSSSEKMAAAIADTITHNPGATLRVQYRFLDAVLADYEEQSRDKQVEASIPVHTFVHILRGMSKNLQAHQGIGYQVPYNSFKTLSRLLQYQPQFSVITAPLMEVFSLLPAPVLALVLNEAYTKDDQYLVRILKQAPTPELVTVLQKLCISHMKSVAMFASHFIPAHLLRVIAEREKKKYSKELLVKATSCLDAMLADKRYGILVAGVLSMFLPPVFLHRTGVRWKRLNKYNDAIVRTLDEWSFQYDPQLVFTSSRMIEWNRRQEAHNQLAKIAENPAQYDRILYTYLNWLHESVGPFSSVADWSKLRGVTAGLLQLSKAIRPIDCHVGLPQALLTMVRIANGHFKDQMKIVRPDMLVGSLTAVYELLSSLTVIDQFLDVWPSGRLLESIFPEPEGVGEKEKLSTDMHAQFNQFLKELFQHGTSCNMIVREMLKQENMGTITKRTM
eukprot:GFYU01013012.1.p1 GENE.GFYU01013012.1~~GFYU01013012.1.p1  ORF type:complete len:652 (+),score=156.72 GFYU01013012.1:254-1957(+)